MTIDASKSIPIETKKRALKTSRKGRISSTTWWLYSDSETTSPAMNAPSARGRSRLSVSQAAPSATSTVNSVNSSRPPARTTTGAMREKP